MALRSLIPEAMARGYGTSSSKSGSARGKVIAVDKETRYEHGKKFTPLLQELGAAGTNLTRAQVVIPNLLPLI